VVFPENITLRLQDSKQGPLRIAGVLLGIRIFAERKNDFFLQPFVTDNDGIVVVSKRELMAEVAAHYDSGLMDYMAVEGAKSVVEVCAVSVAEIQSAIVSRSKIWTSLLAGERERWSSIDELIETYRRATNAKVSIVVVRKEWNGHTLEDECALSAQLL
jgi:hypothetical protein